MNHQSGGKRIQPSGNRPSIEVTMDVDAPARTLEAAVKRIGINHALGFAGAHCVETSDAVKLPDTLIQVVRREAATELDVAEFRHWVTRAALSDLITAFEHFLIEQRTILGMACKGDRLITKTAKLSDLLAVAKKEATAGFDRMNWPKRLKNLRDEFALSLPWEDEFLSINQARNCVNHRRGLVGPEDVNDPTTNTLCVSWRRMMLIAQNPDSKLEREVTHDSPIVNKGEALGVKTGVLTTRKFELDERVEFATEEFVQIVYTILFIGIAFSNDVKKLVFQWIPIRQPSGDS